MARKPTPTTALTETPAAINETAVAEGQAALTAIATLEREHDSAVRQLAIKVGYALPADCTDPDLIQRDIAANMRRSVEACLEVGRGLAVLKQACEHGQFLSRLDSLGIEARIAQRFIQSATRFSNAASTPLLKAAGNQTKLFEMLVLEDEQVEELEETGKTGSLSLDDVASMSVKELRAAVRLERETRKAEKERLEATHKSDMLAKDRLMVSVRERANAAEEKLSRFETKGIPLDERFNQLSDDVLRLGKRADDALVEMANLLTAIDFVLTEAFDPDSSREFDKNGAIALAQRVRDQGFRLARTVGRIQATVDTSIYPLIEAEEMYVPYTEEDGRPIAG
jgi:hypothetical protein